MPSAAALNTPAQIIDQMIVAKHPERGHIRVKLCELVSKGLQTIALAICSREELPGR